MSSFVYSPGVQVRIATQSNGIIDVSEDIVNASITLNEDQTHQLSLTLLNPRRRYDGVFTPMDRFTVQLKRLKWLPIISGYLGTVPYFTVWPKSISLRGECSLRRLKYYLWDPNTTEGQRLITQAIPGSELGTTDGGAKLLIRELASEVGGWNNEHIHIGEIPAAWLDVIGGLFEDVQDSIEATRSLGTGTMSRGRTVDDLGPTSRDDDPFHQLPETKGRATWFGGPNGGAHDTMNLSGEDGSIPDSQRTGECGRWYIAMRWPYFHPDHSSSNNNPALSGSALYENQRWWRSQKILVYNPTTDKAVVVRPADWGPKLSTGNNVDLSQTAYNALNNAEADHVEVRFAPEGATCGPVNVDSIRQGEVEAGTGRRGWEEVDPHTPDTGAGRGHPSGGMSEVTDPNAPGQGHPSGGVTGGASPGVSQDALNVEFTTGPDGLKAHPWAAWQFIESAFPGTSFGGGVAERPYTSDHTTGHAIDISGPRDVLDQVAYWFAENPEAFGTKYVIWWNRQISRKNPDAGWTDYSEQARSVAAQMPGADAEHRNHVHLSFEPGTRTSVGPMGGNWDNNFNETVNVIDPTSTPGLIGTDGLAGSFENNPYSDIFQGSLALMNDKPLLDDIRTAARASMRSMCSAPNGDLIAWFPDHFGLYGTAATMTVRPIEITDLEMHWSDERLKTHQFVAGGILGMSGGLGGGGEATPQRLLEQMGGIASIDFPQLLQSLFGETNRISAIDSRNAILERFGARQEYEGKDVLIHPQAQLWYAVKKFMDNWANQFSTKLGLTFMPELFPGMLIEVEGFNLRLYVKQVTHNIDFRRGFTTSATVVAPSRKEGDGGLFGLDDIKGMRHLRGSRLSVLEDLVG